MVGEAMCLYDGSQWCSVCGEEEGSKNRSLGNPSDQFMCFGYLPWKTDQWDRIQTSEVESQWYPVINNKLSIINNNEQLLVNEIRQFANQIL